jgi:NDP-sugar pyrophosphorylase family protein
MINQIFIFAAGMGHRMMPLTKNIPKPLLKIENKPLLGHILDKIKFLNAKIIINGFYLPDKIEDFIKNHQNETINEIIFSKENEKLETGGGLKFAIESNIIDMDKPLLLINGDLFWKEDKNILLDFINQFDPDKMDILLSIIKKERYFGYEGNGDFNILPNLDKKIFNLTKSDNSSFAFTGIYIINPNIIKKYCPKDQKYFSMSYFFKLKQLKLKGYISEGDFYHIGRPEFLKKIQN